MWKCSQCETLNGDDSPICIICGMSREEVLAEQKRLELERALAASIPAKKPEVTLNWPKEEDTPAPEESAKKPRWKDLRDSMDEQTRERWQVAGRVLAFAALLVLVAFHVAFEIALATRVIDADTLFDRLWTTLYSLTLPVMALMLPFLLGKKRRSEALIAATVFALNAFITAVILENNIYACGFISQIPTLLLAVVLLRIAWQGEIADWVVPTMWVMTALSLIGYILIAHIDFYGDFSFKPRIANISFTNWKFFFCLGAQSKNEDWFFSHMDTLYPIHRVFLALAVTLLFRVNREK